MKWRRGRRSGDPTEKKPGLIRRLWRRFRQTDWKNPVNRWKLVFSVFALLVFGGLFMYGAIAVTSTPTFCKSCHEMAPEYQTFQASSHNQIKCTQCHIKPGAVSTLLHKVKSLGEVYHHVTKTIPNPVVMTEKIENETCMQCHSKNRLVTATGDLKVNHVKHVEKEIPCTICHQGVAHAKVVDRGLNTHDKYDAWTEENQKKLVNDAFMRPNMGTCIDCHEKVNEGKEPWKEEVQEAKEEGVKAVDAKEQTDQREKTVQLILKSLGKSTEGTKPKISMECFTCHKEISTPKNHDIKDWNQNHGQFAIQELNKCEGCHQESKWIKTVPMQDIELLLNSSGQTNTYTKNLTAVKNSARANSFCGACHKDRPPGHTTSDQWLTAHAVKAKTADAKKECFVCHDYDKQKVTNAPTDVYCKFCHRTGFKDGTVPN